jgi:hypothetical protein
MIFRLAPLIDVILSLQSNSLHDHVTLPQPRTLLNKWISVHEQTHHFPLHKIIIKSKSTNWTTGSGTYNPQLLRNDVDIYVQMVNSQVEMTSLSRTQFYRYHQLHAEPFHRLSILPKRHVFGMEITFSHSSHVIPHTQTRVNETLKSRLSQPPQSLSLSPPFAVDGLLSFKTALPTQAQ